MATLGLLQTLILCFIITTVVSQPPVVSVDELEDGGNFSVTCDASRITNIPSGVTDITRLRISFRQPEDTRSVVLAEYLPSGSGYENIPSGRKWTIDFTGFNNGTNNRNTMKLVIQVNDAVCQDAGRYYCNVWYRSVIGVVTSIERWQNVTSKSYFTLYADKNFEVPGRPNYSEYEEGDNITLTCRINGPEELELKWKTGTYDTVSDLIISDYPYDNDITTFDPTLIINSTCNQYAHMSVLNLRSLSQAVNDQVMYLCVVTYNDQPNATEVASANLTIGVTSIKTTTPRSTTTPTTTPSTTTPEHTGGDDDDSELCPEEFCKNGGTCVGLYTCDCSSTDFFGPTCQDTREEIPINDYDFGSIDQDNNIVVTSSGNLSFQGSVTLRRQDNKVSLVIPAGSYVTLDGPVKTSCLGDIDACTSGFTIITSHSFSNVSSTETLVALTTGAHLEAGVKGVSLYYMSGNVNCHVVTSTQEWSIVQKFTLIENEWYNMTVSWHIGQGLDLLHESDVIGSDAMPDKLPVKATDEKPILIGSDQNTTSNSEMDVNGLIASPLFWKEIQRAGISITKDPSSESTPLEIAQIVGIAFGCIAVLVFSTVAIVGLVHHIRKDAKDKPQTPGFKPTDGYITPSDNAYSRSTSSTYDAYNNSNNYSMSTSSTHADYNNSYSPDFVIPPPDYDDSTNDDYLTLEPETTFSNPALQSKIPRGNNENIYDRILI